jgi:hypothetical protein
VVVTMVITFGLGIFNHALVVTDARENR